MCLAMIERGLIALPRVLALAGVLCVAAPAQTQDRLSSEDVQKIGTKLLQAAGKPADVQIKVDATADKGDGIKHESLTAIILPDRKLTVAVLEAAGAEVVPVGTLWLRKLTPSVEGKAVASEKLRSSKVETGEDTIKVTWYLIGVKKTGDKLELVIFGSDKKPLLETKLDKEESSDSNEKTPIFLGGEKDGEEGARLFLSIVGKYKASVPMLINPE